MVGEGERRNTRPDALLHVCAHDHVFPGEWLLQVRNEGAALVYGHGEVTRELLKHGGAVL